MSPYIFILCVELLSSAIKINPNINGITINNSEYLINQFADDTSFTLSDDPVSLETTLNILEDFAKVSGLKINLEKTQAIWIGARRGCGLELLPEKKLLWNHQGAFKLLGIKYNFQKTNIFEDNYIEKLNGVQKLLKDWSFRNLTYIGRVTIIRTLALPIFIQTLTVLPNPPSYIISELQKTFFNFLWDGKPDKIKRNVMYSDYINGGLRFPHILTFCNALKMAWIKKIVDPSCHAAWKILLLDKLECVGGDRIFKMTKDGLKELSKKFNTFWREVFISWASLQEHVSPTTPEEVISQPIFFNNFIKRGNNFFLYEHWCKKDIFFIADLLENNQFMSYETFSHKYNININFIEYFGVINAIPRNWKEIVVNTNDIEDIPIIPHKLINYLNTHDKVTKYFYHIMIRPLSEKPINSQRKWQDLLNTDISDKSWELIYLLPREVTDDTKLINFNYKLVHRILYTNTKLMKCKLSETELCTFCTVGRETILHLFWECSVVKTFWLLFMEMLGNKWQITLPRHPKTFLFGVTDIEYNYEINFLLLLMRYYIYLCKLKNTNPTISECKKYINNYNKIEDMGLHTYHHKKQEKIKNKWIFINHLLN